MERAHLVDGKAKLKNLDPAEDGGLSKPKAQERTAKLLAELYELQEMLFAAGSHALLIVLQGMDTSGKEGAIGCLSKGMNVHGVQVSPFKQPTSEELAHDFLWRIHQRTPGKGQVGIFNRSHYEDVLVVRVHELVPKDVWKGRYQRIREFEENLLASNTIILKFFLHISKEEQEERLRAREEQPEKAWKLSLGDWKERALWDDYMEAYEDALSKTSTKDAPWLVVPGNHKWYRDVVVVETVLEALRPYRAGWMRHLKEVGKKSLAEIEAFRSGSQ